MFASCKIHGSSETIDVLLVLPVTHSNVFRVPFGLAFLDGGSCGRGRLMIG